MAKIRVDVEVPVYTGQPLTFKSPCNCATVDGLIVYWYTGTQSKTFQFADAHGANVSGKNLFAQNSLVKVILDVELSRAYVQNADTNAYLEGALAKKYSPDNKPSASDVGAVPTSRKINNHSLDNDINLTASDVGARPSSWTPTPDEVKAVPVTREINGHQLNDDVTLVPSDVGCAPAPIISQTDITAGSYPLANGQSYHVYE